MEYRYKLSEYSLVVHYGQPYMEVITIRVYTNITQVLSNKTLKVVSDLIEENMLETIKNYSMTDEIRLQHDKENGYYFIIEFKSVNEIMTFIVDYLIGEKIDLDYYMVRILHTSKCNGVYTQAIVNNEFNIDGKFVLAEYLKHIEDSMSRIVGYYVLNYLSETNSSE